MFLAHTSRSLEPSYYCNTCISTTHIEHIAVPLSVWKKTELEAHASMWIKSGRRVQLIKSPTLADHVPVVFSCRRALYVCTVRVAPRVCRDSIMRCLLHGYKRNTLVSNVEHVATRFEEAWKSGCTLNSPSVLYNCLVSIMSEAMLKTFPKTKHSSNEAIKQLSEQRTLIIKERGEVALYTLETNWVLLCSMQKLLRAWRTHPKLDVVNHKLANSIKKHKSEIMQMQELLRQQ